MLDQERFPDFLKYKEFFRGEFVFFFFFVLWLGSAPGNCVLYYFDIDKKSWD